MPLHDWTDDRGWDSVHQLWINALLYWLQDRLPAGYRAYLGSVPGLSIGTESGRPDIGVRSAPANGAATAGQSCGALVNAPQPDFHAIATLPSEPAAAVHVFYHGQLVAAMELVSPRNKDRPAAPSSTATVTWAICGPAFTCCWWTCIAVRSVSRSSRRWRARCNAVSQRASRHMR